MKFLVVFSVFLLCVNLSQQLASFADCDEKHPVIANPDIYSGFKSQCVYVKCQADGSFMQKGCPELRCPPGKELGQKDLEKISTETYPKCCGGPICAP